MGRLDEFMTGRQYANRSEAVRDRVRAGLEGSALQADGAKQCLGAAIYVDDHEARGLSRGLTRTMTSRSPRCTCTSITTAAWR